MTATGLGANVVQTCGEVKMGTARRKKCAPRHSELVSRLYDRNSMPELRSARCCSSFSMAICMLSCKEASARTGHG